MTTTAGANMFKRCNVSEDIIKRFSSIKKDKPNVLNVSVTPNRIPMHSTSPTSKTAALEKLLLSVPLTEDVASFSDNDNDGTSQARKYPLYSDHTDVSVCLPSSGYKSAPEGGGGKYQIRTNSKAQKLTPNHNENRKNSVVKRSSSLRVTSVTDRVSLFKEKLSQSNNSTVSTTTTPATASNDAAQNNNSKTEETHKPALRSSSLGSVNKWNNTGGGTKSTAGTTSKPPPEKNNTDAVPVTKKVFGKGRPSSYNQIHDSWELRKPNEDSNKSEDDVDHPRYRRECRRLKREAYLKAHLCEKSDSETENEDGQLTKAGLERLERRNKFAALRGRRGRIDKNMGGTQDENNNETSSDKTLDSGVFDLYLSNYTEDINKLSQRYDSKEFLLDDTLSLKSGYSSASDSLADSIADSVTTLYDSNDEHQWDVNKTRVAHKNKTKSIISNMNKIAVTNATSNTNKLTQNHLKTHHTSVSNSSIKYPTSNLVQNIDVIGNTNNNNNNNNNNIQQENQRKGSLGVSRIPITSTANDKKTGDLKIINKETNGDKKLILTSDCQVKSSANSLNKYSNLYNDIQLTTKNIIDTTQLNSNSHTSKTCNHAEKTIELDNTNDKVNNRNNLAIVIPISRNKDDELDNFNKSIAEKKSNLKPTTKLKEQINIASGISSKRDRIKNVNNNPSGQRTVINGHRERDENDGGKDKLQQQQQQRQQQQQQQQSHNMPDLKATDGKSTEDGEQKLPMKQQTYGKNIASHLSKKALHKQGATELSLLPTNKAEPIKIEKKQRTLANDKKIIAETTSKAIQCNLLADIDLVTVEAITDISVLPEQIVPTDAIDILGQELLDDIQFKYPENFVLTEDLETRCTHNDGEEIVVSDQLKMDNARLQKLLIEVERARSGTIKALLHVNALLNKVQVDNAKLKSDIEVSLKEKELLKENLKEIKDQAKPVNARVLSSSTSGERWKRDKIELMTQLEKSRTKAEEAEKELLRLRAQYKKVKEQLEHSNNAFTTTLKNNLDATKRLELELQGSLEEKQELLTRCNEGNKLRMELESLREEMEEMKCSHEELQDEKEQLEEKIRHLEKKRQQLLDEQEELQEQISHSQEIIEKLSDAGETLKDRLQKEIKEKEYLQECLEETGQILYQLKINERKLLEDKHSLQYELETEAEEKEALQSSLSKTKTEHQDLIERLQNMTNIHLTVKESLQLANKKEKNYQEQIEALTKTNHILHYTLEKEKEERTDLQEMLEIIDLNYRRMKDQSIGKEIDNEQKVGRITDENLRLTEINASLETKCNELKANMEKEEESKRIVEERLADLEKVKEEVENNLNTMREQQIENEKNMNHSIKVRQDLEEHLRVEQEKVSRLTKSLEQTKKMLQQVDLELSEARKKLEQFKGNQSNLEEKTRESRTRLKELENTIRELTEVRDKYFNRMNYYETETKLLRKSVNEQTEQIGTLQLGTQRLTRERDKLKRNVETTLSEFESHKTKCGETLKRLKNEVIELSSKLVEKGRIAIKHKEQIDNSKSDLEVLRKILDADVNVTVNNMENNLDENSTDIEKLNLQILRDTHDKFRVEFQSHVEKLEDMLKESRTSSDTITVVQSPMSKIKLEEVKFLRSETFEVHTDVTSIKRKIANIEVQISDMQLGLSNGTDDSQNKVTDELALEIKLSKLNELVTQIECRHHAVINQNSLLLEKTLIDDDVTAKDLVKKFQVVSLQGENRQLKAFVGLLQKKYNFNEEELQEELKIISAGDKISMSELISIANQISNTKEVPCIGLEGSPEIVLSSPRESSLNEQYVNSESRRNKIYNSFNQMLTPTSSNNLSSRSYSRSLQNRSACSTPTYCSDEDDIFNLPRRYHSVPRRRIRPRSSYS